METNHGYANDIPFSLAVRAHSGTSHTPERRAEQEIRSYVEQLETDDAIYRAEIEAANRHGNTKLVEAYQVAWAKYRDGYAKRCRERLEAKARCVSPLVTGPANFPLTRAHKANRVADKRAAEADAFRVASLRELRRIVFPNEAPIASGDENAIERLRAKLEAAEKFQAYAKKANPLVRKILNSRDTSGITWNTSKLQACLVEFGQATAEDIRAKVAELLKPDSLGNVGIPSYKLTNNGAEIRRLKARIESVSKAKATDVKTDYHTATMITMTIDQAANRVRLKFPGKPDAATRASLKANGFRWAPTVDGGVWQAYNNARSHAAAYQIATAGAHGYDGAIVDTGSRP